MGLLCAKFEVLKTFADRESLAEKDAPVLAEPDDGVD